MTGTADTEAAEFKKIYDLDVSVIPTNQLMIRTDFSDVIYKTRREKFDAAMDEIIELHQKGQPVLVGTISIDISESFSEKLKKRGIKHTVLNAKNHEKEAEIIRFPQTWPAAEPILYWVKVSLSWEGFIF